MKKDASKLMSEEKFWTIIENSNRGRKLKECLTLFPKKNCLGLDIGGLIFAIYPISKTYGLWPMSCLGM